MCVHEWLRMQNAEKAPHSHSLDIHAKTYIHMQAHLCSHMCSGLALATHKLLLPHRDICVCFHGQHLPLSRAGRPPHDPPPPVPSPPPPFPSFPHFPLHIEALSSKLLPSDNPGPPLSTTSGSGPGQVPICDCISQGRNEDRWSDFSTRQLA